MHSQRGPVSEYDECINRIDKSYDDYISNKEETLNK